ncbi:zinc finger, CCHC-type containing protein [Tanacetum coccineum]
MSGEHLKRDCPKYNHKKSQGFVRNKDQVSGSEVDGRFYFLDFEEYDGGKILLGDGSKCRIRGTEGFTVKIESVKIKVVKGSLVVLSGTRRANCVCTLDGQAVTRKTLKGRKQLGEYYTGWKIKKGNVLNSCYRMSTKSGVAKHLGVAWIQLQNGLVEETNVTLLAKLVNRSPSSAIGFKTHVDMLGFFGWLASIKKWMLEPVKVVLYRNMGFNESREYKKTFIGSGVGTSSVKVLQGVEFEVESWEDRAFEVEPLRNDGQGASSQKVQTQDLIYYHLARDMEQHSTHELFSYREDSNKAAFAVATIKKIYAHESLTFNDTVACEVISKCKVGLKEEMDARSDVWYSFSCGCKVEIWVTKCLLDKAKGNVPGMEIARDQSGNTLRVSQSRFYNGKLVQTLLEGHSILSLEGSLSRDCDVKKNASADVGMMDGFDRGLQTNVHVFVDFDYAIGRSITIMGRSITGYGSMIQGCAGSWKAYVQHMEALSTTEVAYMTLTEAAKEAIWLKGLAIELRFELKIVASIATCALLKAIPSPRFQHSNKGLYEIKKLLDALHGALPKMSLIASDFNYIPDVKEPRYHIFDDDQLFVQKGGCNTDYNSYLDAKGDVDIFFQTDFDERQKKEDTEAQLDMQLAHEVDHAKMARELSSKVCLAKVTVAGTGDGAVDGDGDGDYEKRLFL